MKRVFALWRTAAAPLHRAQSRFSQRSSWGRLLNPIHLNVEDRGDDASSEELHHRDRHPQHAAGRSRQRCHPTYNAEAVEGGTEKVGYLVEFNETDKIFSPPTAGHPGLRLRSFRLSPSRPRNRDWFRPRKGQKIRSVGPEKRRAGFEPSSCPYTAFPVLRLDHSASSHRLNGQVRCSGALPADLHASRPGSVHWRQEGRTITHDVPEGDYILHS